jgi:hypothetical protein
MAEVGGIVGCGGRDLIINRSVASQSPWRMAVPLPAGLSNSHRNGGSDFLIFVADPRTVRLFRNSLATTTAIPEGAVRWFLGMLMPT